MPTATTPRMVGVAESQAPLLPKRNVQITRTVNVLSLDPAGVALPGTSKNPLKLLLPESCAIPGKKTNRSAQRLENRPDSAADRTRQAPRGRAGEDSGTGSGARAERHAGQGAAFSREEKGHRRNDPKGHRELAKKEDEKSRER